MSAEGQTARLAAHVTIHPVGDGAVVFDAKAGCYAQVNGTALRVLRGVLEGIASDGIVRGIVTDFGAAREQVERDVAECLLDMQRRSWFEVDPA